jgi:DNA-binding IclR family transcriptional regulator
MDESDLDGIKERGEAGRTRSVPVLLRALTVLESLASSSNGLTLAEVARRLQIPKSSAHCILLTLLRQGYVSRSDRTRRYVLGQKVFSLASHALAGQRVREAAMSHLRKLMLATNLTVHMGVLDGSEAILVAKLDPLGVTGLATWLGRRMEVHCTGIGKALIAHLPPEELRSLLRSRTFPRHNENTIVSAKRLMQELETVRSTGYAIDDEEDELGFRCIGVPVLENGQLVAAISVAGTTDQVTSENTKELVRHLSKTAEAIQETLLPESDS